MTNPMTWAVIMIVYSRWVTKSMILAVIKIVYSRWVTNAMTLCFASREDSDQPWRLAKDILASVVQ